MTEPGIEPRFLISVLMTRLAFLPSCEESPSKQKRSHKQIRVNRLVSLADKVQMLQKLVMVI